MPYDLPYKIRKNANLETLYCVNGTVDCKYFPEVESVFSTEYNKHKITLEEYKDALFHREKRIDIKKSKYSIIYPDIDKTCKLGEIIKVEIMPYDSNNNQKRYSGDYWIVRLTSNDSTTLIPGIQKPTHTNKEIFEIKCSTFGTYYLQLFFVRSAEAVEAQRRVMNGANSRNRQWSGSDYHSTLKNEDFEMLLHTSKRSKSHCDALLNTFEKPEKLCQFGTGQDNFYCYKTGLQKRTNCSAVIPYKIEFSNMGGSSQSNSPQKLSNLLKKFNLDETHGRLVFEEEIE